MKLTPAGRRLYDEARKLIEQADRVGEILDGGEPPREVNELIDQLRHEAQVWLRCHRLRLEP